MEYLLAIDVGTTGLKSVLFTQKGILSDSEYVEYETTNPSPKGSEQDPRDWWSAAKNTLSSLFSRSEISPGQVAGIGLCGQMHTAALLDSSDSVIRPAITWMDQRSSPQVQELENSFSGQKLRSITANFPTTTYTLSHLLWLKEQEPESFERIDKVLVAKDYLKYKLTGQFTTEYSDASGTYLLDYNQKDWSSELCHYLGLGSSNLPSIHSSTEVIGKITPQAAEETGLEEGTPVIAGSADQSAGAVGVGSVTQGQVTSVIGTAGVVSACSTQPKTDPEERILCWHHSVPDMWQLLGVMQTAGASLHWFRNAFETNGNETGEENIYERYNRSAREVPVGSDGLIFLPYLEGERSPHWDPNARGVFFGISSEHHKEHFIRAIMEGVAFGIKDSTEIMGEMGVELQEIHATGGGYKGSLWRQIVADVTGIPIKLPEAEEGSALGAAILAGVGTGIYPSVEEAVSTIVNMEKTVEPNEHNTARYQKIYEIYTQLYTENRELFTNLQKQSGQPK